MERRGCRQSWGHGVRTRRKATHERLGPGWRGMEAERKGGPRKMCKQLSWDMRKKGHEERWGHVSAGV